MILSYCSSWICPTGVHAFVRPPDARRPPPFHHPSQPLDRSLNGLLLYTFEIKRGEVYLFPYLVIYLFISSNTHTYNTFVGEH